MRDGSWSGHGCQHFLSHAPLNLQMKGAQDTFSNICDSCNRISTNKPTTPVTTKSNTNESKERKLQLVNYLLLIFSFATIILCVFIDYFVLTIITIAIIILIIQIGNGQITSATNSRALDRKIEKRDLVPNSDIRR